MLTRCAPSVTLTAAAATTLSTPPASDTAIIHEKVLTNCSCLNEGADYTPSAAGALLATPTLVWRNNQSRKAATGARLATARRMTRK